MDTYLNTTVPERTVQELHEGFEQVQAAIGQYNGSTVFNGRVAIPLVVNSEGEVVTYLGGNPGEGTSPQEGRLTRIGIETLAGDFDELKSERAQSLEHARDISGMEEAKKIAKECEDVEGTVMYMGEEIPKKAACHAGIDVDD